MPFERRPDSWLLLPGSSRSRNRAAAAGTDNHESLSEFAPETARPAIVAPHASIPPRVLQHDIKASAKRIEHSAVRLDDATRVRVRARTFERRALAVIASLATRVRKLHARSTDVSKLPLWGQVWDLRRLATSAPLISFAGGAVTGVLIVSFVGAEPALPAAPSTAQAVRLESTLRPPALPASSPDREPAATDSTASSTSRPSIVSTTPHPIGTSGNSTDGLNQAVTRSRVAPGRSARRPGGADGVRPASYRGSLEFRSAPQGARVFVNGAFVGMTPLVLADLPVGSRAVRIEADGYRRWSVSTQVVANQQRRVSATLDRVVP